MLKAGQTWLYFFFFFRNETGSQTLWHTQLWSWTWIRLSHNSLKQHHFWIFIIKNRRLRTTQICEISLNKTIKWRRPFYTNIFGDHSPSDYIRAALFGNLSDQTVRRSSAEMHIYMRISLYLNKHILTKNNLPCFPPMGSIFNWLFLSSTGDSSPSAVLAELSRWWSSAERTQRWDKHLEVLWDQGGPWVQAGLRVPSRPASLAGRQRLCRDVHADLRSRQKCCLVFGPLSLLSTLSNAVFTDAMDRTLAEKNHFFFWQITHSSYRDSKHTLSWIQFGKWCTGPDVRID